MYSLKPPAIFVHKRVYRNAKAVKRSERMLKARGDPPVEEVETADTGTIAERAGIGTTCPAWSDDLMNGFLKPQGTPRSCSIRLSGMSRNVKYPTANTSCLLARASEEGRHRCS
jgi:hypothetical protein